MVLLRVETALPEPCAITLLRRLLHRNRLVMKEPQPLVVDMKTLNSLWLL